MQLPEEDELYLKEKGFSYEVMPQGNEGLLIIKDYPVNSAIYDHEKIDLLIFIPTGYNISKLDMFWVCPHLKLKDGSYPQAANYFQDYIGRNWQRFSRHLQAWQPGIDGLPMFLSFVNRELVGGHR